MEGLRRRIGWPAAALVLTCAALVIMPAEVSAHLVTRLFVSVFVYDRNQMNVLEVNKTNYENCNSDNPLHNWTTGAGRDVVPLNVTKTYYFISGKGFCYGGMKVAIHVEKLPPPPSSLPQKSGSPGLLSTFRGQIFVPTLFAIAAVWDSFLYLW
ncbi:Lamin-like protein [Forsythia ovata]|uniref:Lamin-like protein n=1 Tax=Forsythia ovata TaxID=205694 RepID=A0ABD1UUG4_9LAMI